MSGKEKPPRSGDDRGGSGNNTSRESRADPRVAQDVAPHRLAHQRAPRWTPPAGWGAADLLDAALRAPRRR